MTDIETLIDVVCAPPVARRDRTVTVHCDDGRRTVEVQAESCHFQSDGSLVLLDADGAMVASFAADTWTGATADRRHPVANQLRPASWLRICLRHGPRPYRWLIADARAGGFDGRQLTIAARLLGVQFLQCPDGPAWYLPPHSRSDAERLVRELMHGGWRELGEQSRRRIARDAIALLIGQS